MPPPLRVTLDVIAELVDRWPDLNDSRIKGTRRPLTGMTLGKPVREDDGMRGIGETPAPVHLDVLDTMRVLFDGQVYEIAGVLPDPTARRYLTLALTTGVPYVPAVA